MSEDQTTDTISKLKEEIETLKFKLDSTVTAMRTFYDSMKDKDSLYSTMKSENQELKTKLSKTLALLGDIEKRKNLTIYSLNETICDLNRRLDALNYDAPVHEQELLMSRLRYLESQVMDKSSKIASLELRLSVQNLENSTNTKRSVDLQNDLDLANQHIRSLERQLAKLTEEKSE